jgi:hypothetical protein
MLAAPRSLSQLTAPFFAIPSQAIHHTASLCRMINIPGGCLREPYAWPHRRGAREGPTVPCSPFLCDSRRTVHLDVCHWLCFAPLQCVFQPPICCTKEVIRLQVPLQPPCYDFSPLA